MEAQRLLAGDEARPGDQRVEPAPPNLALVRGLSAVERALVERFGAALLGRVLLVGCSVGRFTAQLHLLALELHGVCDRAADVARCRRAYPHAVFTQCDPRDLADFAPCAFGAAVVPGVALDVLDDDERRAALCDIRALLTQDGLLIFSVYNRDCTARPTGGLRALLGSRNHVEAPDCLSRDAHERQLSELGYDVLECLDCDGRRLEGSASRERSRRLYFVARA
ncbi:MAG TPA: class I SAM-dependent methyltransferase [Solirubrobacteraceae bacterium]|nr:class I SAM-dependent methyltransferase [Solirubrobacteraceae bacterium]